jgi:hypothetical protein
MFDVKASKVAHQSHPTFMLVNHVQGMYMNCNFDAWVVFDKLVMSHYCTQSEKAPIMDTLSA